MSWADQQQDTDRLRQRVDAADARNRRQVEEDVVIEFPRRLFLRAPGGTFYQIAVTDAGDLTATAVIGSPL